MRTKPDINLSRYFKRHQIIEGTAIPIKARALNWKYIDDYIRKETLFIKLCQALDNVILDLNQSFKHILADGTLTFSVSSGYRCREWEILQKRSGKSQHCTAAALDIYPITNKLTDKQLVEVMTCLQQKYWETWPGGFAVKAPTFNNDKSLKSIGFIHFDLRPTKVRWYY